MGLLFLDDIKLSEDFLKFIQQAPKPVQNSERKNQHNPTVLVIENA
jgi:hypothetical protein